MCWFHRRLRVKAEIEPLPLRQSFHSPTLPTAESANADPCRGAVDRSPGIDLAEGYVFALSDTTGPRFLDSATSLSTKLATNL